MFQEITIALILPVLMEDWEDLVKDVVNKKIYYVLRHPYGVDEVT